MMLPYSLTLLDGFAVCNNTKLDHSRLSLHEMICYVWCILEKHSAKFSCTMKCRWIGDMNNNKMERMNGEFRDREKVARGLKKDDSVLINGYQIFHNYIRPHMALDGKTPSEACGITIQGDDKWKTLIQRASL